VTCAADVLELYGRRPGRAAITSLGPCADVLLSRLRDSALTADELVRSSPGSTPVRAPRALTALELGGRVTVEDGVYPRGDLGSPRDVHDSVLAREPAEAAPAVESTAPPTSRSWEAASRVLVRARPRRKAGLEVRLFDGSEIAGGASGRNGGFALARRRRAVSGARRTRSAQTRPRISGAGRSRARSRSRTSR
jgi:hypothetical protein